MFRLIFGIIMISYVWMIYGFLLTRKEEKSEYYEPVSVVIPCYNENKKDLINCVDSIMSADGEKQVILVNNNSNKKETLDSYKYLVDKYQNLYYLNEFTQGKRYAHKKGLEFVNNNIVVFVDSDTVIDRKALVEIVKPFRKLNVGGVAGKVLLLNKNDNILTRSINAMFWTSSSIFRRATGNVGFMQVSAGALSAYRKESLIKLEEEYLNQMFLGRYCNVSDDRFLTIRVQTILGQKVEYVDKAVSFTIMPKTFIGFWKVLERWKRGVIREVLLFWGQPKKKAKMLFLDTQFNFLAMNVMFIFKIIMLYQLIFNFSWIALGIIASWLLLMSMFYGGYMLVNKPKEFGYKIIYTTLYEFFWSWSYINALWNIKNQGKWVTR